MAQIPFRERLEQGVILADGAMGTMLHAQQDLPIDTCFDLLNLTDPDVVAGVHRHYIESGAEIIETNTFSANIIKLSECGLRRSVRRHQPRRREPGPPRDRSGAAR